MRMPHNVVSSKKTKAKESMNYSSALYFFYHKLVNGGNTELSIVMYWTFHCRYYLETWTASICQFSNLYTSLTSYIFKCDGVMCIWTEFSIWLPVWLLLATGVVWADLVGALVAAFVIVLPVGIFGDSWKEFLVRLLWFHKFFLLVVCWNYSLCCYCHVVFVHGYCSYFGLETCSLTILSWSGLLFCCGKLWCWAVRLLREGFIGGARPRVLGGRRWWWQWQWI
jgi:hypothetical protein